MAEARQPGAMPLRLRRAAVQYPRAHWEPSNEHLVILSGETVVGSLMRQTGGTGRRPLVLVDYLRAHRPRREPADRLGHDPGRGPATIRRGIANLAKTERRSHKT